MQQTGLDFLYQYFCVIVMQTFDFSTFSASTGASYGDQGQGYTPYNLYYPYTNGQELTTPLSQTYQLTLPASGKLPMPVIVIVHSLPCIYIVMTSLVTWSDVTCADSQYSTPQPASLSPATKSAETNNNTKTWTASPREGQPADDTTKSTSSCHVTLIYCCMYSS
jgi:hypothetical protein